MKAERERREAILKAEGENKSHNPCCRRSESICNSGSRAEKQAAILRAEAEKELKSAKQKGQAEAIRVVQMQMRRYPLSKRIQAQMKPF